MAKPKPAKSHDATANIFRRSKPLRVLAIIALLFAAAAAVSLILEPGPSYKVGGDLPRPDSSPEFFRNLEDLTASRASQASRVDVLTNGENFYRAELDAIHSAQHTICLENYIFEKGKVAREFVRALTERAQHGVTVNVVLDGMGSLMTHKWYFHDLHAAGGHIAWYHPLRWNTWLRYNNRTHRELLIVDGSVGFVGGAGIGDDWLYPSGHTPRWRDTMLRVDGDVVDRLQATFAQNWADATGQIITGAAYFPPVNPDGAPALVVESAPGFGGSTHAHVLFQLLLAGAQKTIDIETPYFLPDSSARRALLEALGRGVQVRILVPKKSDHVFTRSASRRLYGDLLKAGAHVYEYQPTMMHAKILVVDGEWAVAGSTNFDNRSLGINDEVNLAVRDPVTAARLLHDFDTDVASSRDISYAEWQHRGPIERVAEWVGFLLQRQQ